MWETWEFALGVQRLAYSGMIVIDREAIDSCGLCGVRFRRKNTHRHYWSRRHARAFERNWKRA